MIISGQICGSKLQSHWEIKGRFRKRAVLANVPSFRFSFRGNIRRNHPFQVLGTTLLGSHQKGSLGDKRAVSKRAVLANVPSFRFSFRGNIRRTHPFGNHPFSRPALSGGMGWWRMEWPFSRVRKIFFRGRNFQENV